MIGNQVGLLLALALWAGAMGWVVYRWLRGRPAGTRGAIHARLRALLRDGLGQASTMRSRLAGIMHLLIMLGTVGTLLWASRPGWGFDLAAAALLAGVLLSVYRRASGRLPTRPQDVLLLVLLALLAEAAVAGQVLAAARTGKSGGPYTGLLAALLRDWTPATLIALQVGAQWALGGIVLALLALVPLTKMRHVLAAPTAIWMRDPGPRGRLAPADLEREEGAIGARGHDDLTRKEHVDLDACTRCNRCATACPVTRVGGALNPMQVLSALAQNRRQEPLADVVGPEALWACTTCLACADVCPVGAEPVQHLIDIRRERVLDAADFPAGLQTLYRSLERRGAPWPALQEDRVAWAAGLDVPVLAAGEETDVLIWVGCMGAHDPHQQSVMRALVHVLRAAGLQFATLGTTERCCGDPARRTGNEYLWQRLAEQNVALLQERHFRRIVTLCAHCSNMLGNEYPQLGGTFVVQHATQLVAELIAGWQVSLSESGTALLRVTYQDPCYLARGSGLAGRADAARDVLRSLPGLELVEMEAHGREAVCCGGGGGQMWLERPPAHRPENRRAADIAATGVEVCLVACPYCAQMLRDGLATRRVALPVRDVIEVVAERVVVAGITQDDVMPSRDAVGVF